MSLENFKAFVKKRPNLANFVNRGEMTWQKFYEMYELYGEGNDIWNKYITSSSGVSLKTFIESLKQMDMGEVQKGVESLQKGIGYLKDMVSTREEKQHKKDDYEPRKIYKHFDD